MFLYFKNETALGGGGALALFGGRKSMMMTRSPGFPSVLSTLDRVPCLALWWGAGAWDWPERKSFAIWNTGRKRSGG